MNPKSRRSPGENLLTAGLSSEDALRLSSEDSRELVAVPIAWTGCCAFAMSWDVAAARIDPKPVSTIPDSASRPLLILGMF